MNDMNLGSIFLWPLSWVPEDLAFCNGQLFQIQFFQDLYSLIGTNYGGDGKTTFALPDLRSRVPIGANMGSIPPELTPVQFATKGGFEDSETIMHKHKADIISMPINVVQPLIIGNTNATLSTPVQNSFCAIGVPVSLDPNFPVALGFNNAQPDTQIAGQVFNGKPATSGSISISSTGTVPNGQYANMQPFVALNYVICISGLYPSGQ